MHEVGVARVRTKKFVLWHFDMFSVFAGDVEPRSKRRHGMVMSSPPAVFATRILPRVSVRRVSSPDKISETLYPGAAINSNAWDG